MGGIERIRAPLLDVVYVLIQAHMQGVELHGWAIMKLTGRSGPTVYRVIDRLEDNGWVTGRWEDNPDPSKPRRRYYTLTVPGAVEVRRILAERRPQALELKPSTTPGPAIGTLFTARPGEAG